MSAGNEEREEIYLPLWLREKIYRGSPPWAKPPGIIVQAALIRFLEKLEQEPQTIYPYKQDNQRKLGFKRIDEFSYDKIHPCQSFTSSITLTKKDTYAALGEDADLEEVAKYQMISPLKRIQELAYKEQVQWEDIVISAIVQLIGENRFSDIFDPTYAGGWGGKKQIAKPYLDKSNPIIIPAQRIASIAANAAELPDPSHASAIPPVTSYSTTDQEKTLAEGAPFTNTLRAYTVEDHRRMLGRDVPFIEQVNRQLDREHEDKSGGKNRR